MPLLQHWAAVVAVVEVEGSAWAAAGHTKFSFSCVQESGGGQDKERRSQAEPDWACSLRV